MLKNIIFFLSWLALSCGSVQMQRGVDSTVSLVNLDCASCGAELVEAITSLDGVYQARFRKLEAEVGFRYEPTLITTDEVVSAIEKAGFSAASGAGKGNYQAYPHYPEGSDVVVIRRDGALFKLENHLVPGKYTIIDFFAAWCGPCRKLGESLVEILSSNPNIALRKIDIVDWDRPVAKQHLANVAKLPYVRIYDPAGVLVDDISGLDVARVKRALGLGVADD